jgi:hypothetical protein
MSPEQLIIHYGEKKYKNELNKTDIREELEGKHGLSPEEAKALMTAVMDYELRCYQNQKSPIEKFLSSIFVSYFFLLFGLVVIGVSIYIMRAENANPLNKILPWILIFGAIFMIYKHGSIINSTRKQK